MKTVYGPVASWRLGRSLGIDPVCKKRKICSLDCIYCQLGRTKKKTIKRKVFVSLKRIKKDLEPNLKKIEADIITFSGTAEPTLAENLNQIIDYLREVTDLPLAILTNSSLLTQEEVRAALYKLDKVVAKLDAACPKLFEDINRPHGDLDLEEVVEGIKLFRESYNGHFALQIMFLDKNQQENSIQRLVKTARLIDPDEIQINTPLRPCKVEPLSKQEILKIKEKFSEFKNVITVYEAKLPKVVPLNLGEVRKRKRPEA